MTLSTFSLRINLSEILETALLGSLCDKCFGSFNPSGVNSLTSTYLPSMINYF